MAKKSNVTIKDIAKKLGISFSTVAKALNDDPVVAEETRKRVQEKAQEMGYFPNLMATGLRSNATRTIGIILNDLENPTRSHIVKKISMVMVKHGFTPFIFDSAYDEDIEQRNILNLLSRIPECVIISPVTTQFSNIHLLENLYGRTIILSNVNDQIPTNYVHMDHIKGGYIAAKTVIQKGHTNNLIIMEPLDYPSGLQFYRGITQAYSELGLQVDPKLVSYGYPSIESGMNSVVDFFDFDKRQFKFPITSVIASNDLMAIGVYKASQKIGFKIPDDISVIGYDDLPIASLVSPQLTTLKYPKEKIAEHCTEILLSKLLDNDPAIKQFSLEPDLIIRNSVKVIL